MSEDVKLRMTLDRQSLWFKVLVALLVFSILANFAQAITSTYLAKRKEFIPVLLAFSKEDGVFFEVKNVDDLEVTEMDIYIKAILESYVKNRQQILGYEDDERFKAVESMTVPGIREQLYNERAEFKKLGPFYRRVVNIVSSTPLSDTMYEVEWDVKMTYQNQDKVQKYRTVLTYTVPNILRKDDREWLLDNNAWKTNPFGIQIHEFTYTKRQ